MPSYIPLLLLPLPLSLSPLHLTTLLILTYIVNRPCIYCSLLLTILFASSCHWSGKCLWEAPTSSTTCSSLASNVTDSAASNWAAYFIPRLYTTAPHTCTGVHDASSEGAVAAFLAEISNNTMSGFAAAARESGYALLGGMKQKIVGGGSTHAASTSSGIGTQWLKNLLGRSEWTLPCIGVKVVI